MGAEEDFFRAEGGKAPPLRVTGNVIVIGRGDEGITPYEKALGKSRY